MSESQGPKTLELGPKEVLCLGALCALAKKHPDTLQTVAEEFGVTPIDMMGFVMVAEKLLED